MFEQAETLAERWRNLRDLPTRRFLLGQLEAIQDDMVSVVKEAQALKDTLAQAARRQDGMVGFRAKQALVRLRPIEYERATRQLRHVAHQCLLAASVAALLVFATTFVLSYLNTFIFGEARYGVLEWFYSFTFNHGLMPLLLASLVFTLIYYRRHQIKLAARRLATRLNE